MTRSIYLLWMLLNLCTQLYPSVSRLTFFFVNIPWPISLSNSSSDFILRQHNQFFDLLHPNARFSTCCKQMPATLQHCPSWCMLFDIKTHFNTGLFNKGVIRSFSSKFNCSKLSLRTFSICGHLPKYNLRRQHILPFLSQAFKSHFQSFQYLSFSQVQLFSSSWIFHVRNKLEKCFWATIVQYVHHPIAKFPSVQKRCVALISLLSSKRSLLYYSGRNWRTRDNLILPWHRSLILLKFLHMNISSLHRALPSRTFNDCCILHSEM